MMSSNFRNPIFFLISSFLTLSFRVIPNSLRWKFWWAASSFFICMSGSDHNSAPYSSVEMTSDSYNVIFTGRRMLVLFQIMQVFQRHLMLSRFSYLALLVAVS